MNSRHFGQRPTQIVLLGRSRGRHIQQYLRSQKLVIYSLSLFLTLGWAAAQNNSRSTLHEYLRYSRGSFESIAWPHIYSLDREIRDLNVSLAHKSLEKIIFFHELFLELCPNYGDLCCSICHVHWYRLWNINSHQTLRMINRRVQKLRISFILKHLSYPLMLVRLRGTFTMGRLHDVYLAIYIDANILCSAIGIPSWALFGQRFDHLAMANIIPLCLGGRTNLIANLCYLPLRKYGLMHRWIGRVRVIEALLTVQ